MRQEQQQTKPAAARARRRAAGLLAAAAMLGSLVSGVDAFAPPLCASSPLAAGMGPLPAAACHRQAAMPLAMMAAGGSPAGGRSRTLLFPWRRRSRLAAAAGADADVANDPSGATVVPKPFPPIEPAPQGPNPKAIFALVVGEVLLGCLAFPLGYVFKIDPLGSIRNAFSAAATATVGGLGPALLNALGLAAVFTLPALALHKVSGETIEDMLRESLQQIFGSPESTRRRPLLMLAISFLLSLSAGLGEELLFRGALQPLVASFARSDAVGVGVSSLLFAVLHAATPRYLLLAFVLSVYLGWIQLQTANLFVPIAVHTIFDVVGFLLSLYTAKKKGKPAS